MKSTQTVKGKLALKRRIWAAIILVVVLVAGGAGYFFWKQSASAKAASADSGYKTTTVKNGSITNSITGSGTLAASSETSLNFPMDGTVATLNVKVGDEVKKGDVLAVMTELSDLQAAVNTAQQNLVTAQNTLDTFKSSAAAALANAQLDVATKQKAVTDAKSAVVQKGWVRCDNETTQAYYDQYVRAKDYLDSLGDGGGSKDYYLNVIVPQKNIVAQDYATYVYCSGYTDYEVSSTNAEVALAEAQLTEAEATLKTLTDNNGLDPLTLETDENNVATAQLKLDAAKESLAAGTMTAPFDGTIMKVAGDAGDPVEQSTSFITIADLAHPQVTFSVDESDMASLSVDEDARVVFDAYPDITFKGTVTRIDPTLSSSNGYNVATGVIKLDLSDETNVPELVKGMTATVTLVKASSENVPVVALQALHDLGDGTYSAFVVGQDGQLTMKVVEVGLEDATMAEIKSGLSVGDVVSTGTTTTTTTR
jgi:RND family efflux transporter MFP subunit